MQVRQRWKILLRKLGLKSRFTSKAVHHHTRNDVADFSNLSEVAAPMPIENRDESALTYTHHSLEESGG